MSGAWNDSHTLRAGTYIQTDRAISRTTSQVLPVDADGKDITRDSCWRAPHRTIRLRPYRLSRRRWLGRYGLSLVPLTPLESSVRS